jgi:hypothetical protein
MQALDELVARWRKNPDPESTLALCAHLGTSHEAELMREVANTAEAWHKDNHSVMLSVGRMYLDAGLLPEAQAALLQAGKLEPNDAEAYRYLGEVLLRRGDAQRSEKALARAIQLGSKDSETRLWHERAIVYVALQQRRGLTAVADEVARTAPLPAPGASPPISAFDHIDSEPQPAAARPARRSRPPLATAGIRRSSGPKATRRRGSTPPPPGAFGPKTAPQDTLMMGRSPLPASRMDDLEHPPSPFIPSESHAPKRTAKPAKPGKNNTKVPRREARGGEAAADRKPPSTLAELARSVDGLNQDPQAAKDTHPDAELGGADPFLGTFESEERIEPANDVPAAPAAPAIFARAPRAAAARAPEPASAPVKAAAAVAEPALVTPPALPDAEPFTPPSSAAPLSPARLARPAPVAHARPVDEDEAVPSPETILLTLARVGLYEKESSVTPAWEAAPRPAPRRLWLLGGALAAALLVGVGGYRYAVGVQEERLAEAQALGMRLTTSLESGSRAQLRASDNDFQRLFELDSRGRDPALLWLTNRALYTLLDAEPVSGIESALQRARTVGIEESRLIFGRLASALSAGDLPGAAALISEWDARAKDDALYQLFAGVTFERAGNPVALERYTLATHLSPELKLAHLSAARLSLLQRGPAESKSLVEIASARLGPGAAADVLRGLEWAASPFTTAPAPTLPNPEAIADLSPILQETAHAVSAVRALRDGKTEESMAEFKQALGPATTPALAAWIGYQALDAGDVEVARLSALKAMQLSVQHQSSQALAARIALAEGRLDAARDAVKGVDPSSRDAVLIEAVTAYENLRGADATRMVASLPTEPASAATLEALRDSDKVVAGVARPKDERLNTLAEEQRLWGAEIAVDLALDSGRLELAERIVKARAWDAKVPAHAARLMRLRRYQGQGAAALELAQGLVDREHASVRAVAEVVLGFISEGRVAAATSALRELNAAAGNVGPWLEILVEAAAGRQPNAAKMAAEHEPPGKGTPLLEQVVALRALAAAKDRRAKPYYGQLDKRFRGQPDVALAGKELGLVK